MYEHIYIYIRKDIKIYKFINLVIWVGIYTSIYVCYCLETSHKVQNTGSEKNVIETELKRYVLYYAKLH